MTENYIIIAHPTDFVYGALAAFFKQHGFIAYRLEDNDDVQYRLDDLKPVALLVHNDHGLTGAILESCPEVTLKLTIAFERDGCKLIEEPFDPAEVVKRVISLLESHSN